MMATTENRTVDLLCVAGAGGSAMSFRPLSRATDLTGVNVVPLDLPRAAPSPGPGGESATVGIATYAQRLSARLLALPSVILPGHSLGALVAYEMARAASPLPVGPRVLHLIVLACPAPDRLSAASPPTEPQDDDVDPVEHLMATGELSAAADAVVPQDLRSDLRAWQNYRAPTGAAPLPVPVTVVAGRYNTGIEPVRLERWSKFTKDWHGLRWVPARHDVLAEAAPYTAREVARIVSTTVGTDCEETPHTVAGRPDTPHGKGGTP
ncbi:thioesterase II family protein [Streptomyces sp. G45]|uniref:thioesterase II family protein n=1 Tax=Streptomyces sp. G45 TaxID=3406627 RepID=UPI003C1882E5